MPLLGAHLSIKGGLYNVESQCNYLSCDTFQIFAKNQLRWKMSPLDPHEITQFRKFINTNKIEKFVVHGSYLLNLASMESEIREKSINAFKEELLRARVLGASYFVLHPGSTKDSLRKKEGIKNVIYGICRTLSQVDVKDVKIAVENTAGGGGLIGTDLYELLEILEGARNCGFEIGVCIDTAHAFESGYTLDKVFIDEIYALFGGQILVFHINDSLTEKGSKRDRHSNIGKGLIPIDFFKFLLNDERFQKVPFILETPGGLEKFKEDIETLRSIVS